MKPQRRPQRQKPGKVQQVQELRRSNAAQPIPVQREDKRYSKYGIGVLVDEYDNDEDDPYMWL